MAAQEDYTPVKVLVLGDPETGKTSLIKRLVHDRFHAKYKASTGVQFFLHEVNVNDQIVRLQLWDMAGHENRVGKIAKAYYQDAFGAIVVYDVTRPTTFDTVADWKKEIDDNVKLPNGDPLPVILVGNKFDLETARADELELDKYCAERGFVQWFDVSAKTGYRVDETVRCLAQSVLEKDDIFVTAHHKAIGFRPNKLFEPQDSSLLCSPS